MQWCCTTAVDPLACEQIIRSTGSAQFTSCTKNVLTSPIVFHVEVARMHFDTFALNYLGCSVHKCCRCHATSSTRHCLERIPSCLRFVACSPATTHSLIHSLAHLRIIVAVVISLLRAQRVTLDLRQNRIKTGIMHWRFRYRATE